MKPLIVLLSITLFAVLVVIYLFRGFGPDGQGALFYAYRNPIPSSYFKTPEEAVKRINIHLENGEWRKLAQYYDLTVEGVEKRSLLDGTFFLIATNSFGSNLSSSPVRPFPIGANFYSAHETALDDIFEVTVKLNVEGSAGATQSGEFVFYLKRFPEGYRIVAEPPNIKTQDPSAPGDQ